MRIAPRPKVGQEFSLDRLLAGPGSNPKPVGPAILQTESAFTLAMIPTMGGPVEITICKTLQGPTSWEDIHRQIIDPSKNNGWRAIAGDEFYSVLEQARKAKTTYVDTPEWKAYNDLREWIKNRWGRFGSFALATDIEYSGISAISSVTHRPGAVNETELTANLVNDLRESEEEFSRLVFGSNRANVVYQWTEHCGINPRFTIFYPGCGTYGEQSSSIVAGRVEITAVRENDPLVGRYAILVQTGAVRTK